MAIDFENKAFRENEETWKLIDNICDGRNVTQYLRHLNPHDKSDENKERNRAYKENAIFAAVAGYTIRGLVGTVFRKVPTLTVTGPLDYLKSNADGSGQSIYQQSQQAMQSVLRKGRCGVVVSYPKTEGDTSRADMNARRIFATMHKISPEQIINARLISDGAEMKLGLVVIREMITEVKEDGFTELEIDQITVLSLDETPRGRIYAVRRYRKNENGEWAQHGDTENPRTGEGKYWNEIPFTFIGANDNAITVDQPPALDIVRVNKGHYQNSADYEDSVWYAGQAQPWMSGVDERHMELLTKEGVYSGSRYIMPVPSGEQFGFASPDPNPSVRQAMLDKMELMIGLGARFITPGSANKTATQSEGEQEVQHSILSLSSSNVSEAYTQALKWAARFMRVDEDEVEYALNQDFTKMNADAQEIQAMVMSWQAGAIPQSDLFNWLKRVGRIDPEKDNEALAEEVSAGGGMPDLDAD